MASVNSRYARAFADVVDDSKLDADQVIAELNTLVEMLHASVELKKVWENPSIPAPQKRALLDALVQRAGISRPVRNFVAVMIDHRRVPILPQVVQQLRAELDQRLGVIDAEITSARALGDEEKRDLEARIGRSTGRRVRARYGTDSRILGGAVIRIGSTIYDGSVRGQLHKIRERLSAG